jgi:hypothetical protein
MITRAEYVTMLIRLLELDANVDSNFADVSPVDYYYESVGMAKTLKIVLGIGSNQFKPNQYITRQDMMVMTGRALEIISLEINSDEADAIATYNDVNQVSEYAYGYCNLMVGSELIQGFNGDLMPEANTTRGEVVVYLNRLYELMEQLQ